ncbi:exonuclease [Rhodobacteraceae bacterium RKSG542]|uniref:exonuclease domain-containing protein n=1 Tax=Pseudovibrio flavus TaxID=2529854 RepID=UPI0012BC934F|nr:exonuclease domain-containing protein [Pseudovibrio flavus]MTI17254.1 exonuclease [Pseudovibrio flavus]
MRFLNSLFGGAEKERQLQSLGLADLQYDFITFDFETANTSSASICQIGVAAVRNHQVVDVFTDLVDPEEPFHFGNVNVHGLTEEDVYGAPIYPQIVDKYGALFACNIAVSHSAFDKTAIHRASEKYSLTNPLRHWVDSTRIVRQTWPQQYGKRGYGLGNLAKDFGLEFGHHDAGEDARVTALIVLRALEEGNKTIQDWLNPTPAKKKR